MLTATAQVSPKTIWMAVEVTGARSKGQSSRSSGRRTWSSHACGESGGRGEDEGRAEARATGLALSGASGSGARGSRGRRR